MSEPVTIALAGINGYGTFYLNPLLDESEKWGARLVAAIDPTAAQSPRFNELAERGVQVFDTMDDFYRTMTADIVVIAAPIHYHLPMIRTAVEHNSNVLCEKPLAATAEQANELIQLEKATPAFVAVGYQWSFSKAIQSLKKDILNGKLGKPKRLRTMTLWPRQASYYARNNWAGRMKTDDGQWVLDSPANNATAHYLHNMFYVLGDTLNSSTQPQSIAGKLYRANPIENYDSAAVRVTTDCGADVFFYTTHTVRRQRGPIFHFEFEHADVHFNIDGDSIIKAHFSDGTERDYGDPNVNPLNKLAAAVAAIKDGPAPVCGIQAAAAHTRCIGMLQKQLDIDRVPSDLIKVDQLEEGNTLTWVKGLAETFETAYNNWSLPTGILSK
ncbi:MAG: Gfo/Idh/MocA family oxidoreductase [Candidatus Pacebacteria bacterium]|nr:Gfo/Idh/MocA family oxidoreductase [Candidatus Paceibacterota bacterium]